MPRPPANEALIADAVPPGSGQIWVGFSGGLDSTVLLHALVQSGRQPRAIHVHHGLQPAADGWASHCEQVCTGQGVEFQLCRVSVADDGSGIEGAARKARYAALRGYLCADDVLATAHHLEDQAETVLMRLLRGTGPAGLAAMRPSTEMAPGWLWRPLLDVPRSRLAAYAQTHRLRWIDDPHNADPRFARSFLRHHVLPLLHRHWPGATGALARAAELSGEAAELLDDLAESDLNAIAGSDHQLSIPGLLRLTPARRRNLLRGWVARMGLPSPFHDTLQRLDQEVLGAAPDAAPLLAWPGGEFRRYREWLFAMRPLPPADAGFRKDWDGTGEFALPPGCGVLRPGDLAPGAYLVRLVQPGERARPLGSRATRTLKNLFQDRGIPPWVRERTPVVERAGAVAWIGGIGRVGPIAGAPSAAVEAAVDVQWLNGPPGAAAGAR